MDLRLARGVDWIRLAQDRDRWRTVVNAVMNLLGSCAMELVKIYIQFDLFITQKNISHF
jgi:hypothetical protein